MSGDPADLPGRRSMPVPPLHVFKAAEYSLGGFLRLARERAFRDEAIGLVVVLVLFALAGADAGAYGIQTVLFLVLLSAEALNTAIEVLVDRISPEVSAFARDAKDLGSFAVFCLLCANGGFAFLVLAGMAG